MAKILAEWLEKDYQIKKGQIVSRDELYYIINKEKKKIPDGAVWFKGFSSKDNKDLIINVVKLLKHTHCLQLAREYSDVVQMEKAKRTIVRWPFDDPELHGYAYMENGIIWADGEDAVPGEKFERPFTGEDRITLYYHTNFKLGQEGERIALYDDKGILLDKICHSLAWFI